MKNKIIYPDGAEFAFTILDDTDDSTLENAKPIYDLFKEHNIRTTKTVWALDTPPKNQGPYFAAETLSSRPYLEWVQQLSSDGFEIAFHNATMGSSLREATIKAIDFIEKEMGKKLRLHCNHGQNRENLYWGLNRYNSEIIKRIARIFWKYKSFPSFEGDNPDSPFYWADIADQRLSYMRAFAFKKLNGKHIPPYRPFRRPNKRSGLLFFNTADAPDINAFNELVNPDSINKLCEQRGWAIISTHLGKGFYANKKINDDFKRTIKYLASLPGWFVPVSELLDFLRLSNTRLEITRGEQLKMELLHVLDRIRS